MRRHIAALAAAASVAACSAPDGGDIDDLASTIRSSPDGGETIRQHKENDRIADGIVGLGAMTQIQRLTAATMWCSDRAGENRTTIPYRWVWDYVAKNKEATLLDVFRVMEEEGRRRVEYYNNAPCPPDRLMVVWEDDIEVFVEDARQSEDEPTDSAYWLPTLSVEDLTSRPGLMVVLGLTVVGGVIVVAAVSPVGMLLCPLSDAVECPDSPSYPPGQTPQPAPGDQ